MQVKKAQAAVDFVVSYGMALIIITAAIVIVYKLALTNAAVTAPSCTATPGFSCDFYAINSTGTFTLKLSQAIGTQITLNGAACSSTYNNSGNWPAYGNFHVTNQITYYPAGSEPWGNVIYSDSNYILRINCYDQSGLAKYVTGTTFSGQIWLNYTIPGYGAQTQNIASFTAPYS